MPYGNRTINCNHPVDDCSPGRAPATPYYSDFLRVTMNKKFRFERIGTFLFTIPVRVTMTRKYEHKHIVRNVFAFTARTPPE